MLRAVGFSEDDFAKPQVAVASSWNEVTPCNYHLDKLAALAEGGRAPGRRRADRVHDDRRFRRHRHGSRGDEGIPDVARSDRRLGGAGAARRADGRPRGDRRLRQVRARHADGHGAHQPPSVYLYGGTILPGTYRGRDITIQDVFEAVGAHAKGTIDDAELTGGRARRLPGHRVVRRHVHRQHHGRGGRGPRDVAARAAHPSGGRLPPRGAGARERHPRRRAGRLRTVRGRATS